MKELDFLPESYHVSRLRRQRTRRHVLYSLAVAAGFLALHFSNLTHIRASEAALIHLRSSDPVLAAQEEKIAALQSRRVQLVRRSKLIRELKGDAPMSQVVTELSHQLDEPLAISRIEIESIRDEGKRTGVPPGTWVRMTGVAATDVQVGTLLGRLMASELFDQVELDHTRQSIRDGHAVREFQMHFRVRPIEWSP